MTQTAGIGTTASLDYDSKADLIRRTLERNAPCFYDGFQVITKDMKYNVLDVYGRWELRRAQELSIHGFERNVQNCCHETTPYNPIGAWDTQVQFNPAAEVLRAQLNASMAQHKVDQERIAAQQVREQVERDRKSAENRAAIDGLLAAAKFTKGTVKLTDHSGKVYSETIGKVFGLVAVHKDNKLWIVTHVPSGMRLAEFDTQFQAKIAAV